MQNSESGGIANQAGDRNDAYHSVVSDLLSLIEHIQASRRLIEHTIAREASTCSQEGDIIVLDDVTPPFVTATAALSACDANLAIALGSLLDSTPTARQPGNRARICA